MADQTRKLAVLGGKPAFAEPLHVGYPNRGNRRRFLERVEGALDRNWLTNGGPLVHEFEERIAEVAGTRFCVATCNGTMALEIAIRALGLQGEVIVPSFTFVATAHALQWQGITPVFCDIDAKTHCIDPQQVERMITPRTTGIIGVHLWGRAANVAALDEIAERRGLQILYDASHALGCSHRGQMVGGFGAAEVFSFHATKFVDAFEGGAVVTNSEPLAEKIRLMKNFGFVGYDQVAHVGTNGKMSEIQAARGLTSLEDMDAIVIRNRQNHFAYREALADLPALRLLEYDDAEQCNYQYVVIEVDESAAGLGRDELIAVLQAENVQARRYFHPGCHRMEPYRSLFPHAGLVLPRTEEVARCVLVLPTGAAIDREIVGRICGILREAIGAAATVREHLAARMAA